MTAYGALQDCIEVGLCEKVLYSACTVPHTKLICIACTLGVNRVSPPSLKIKHGV